MNALLPLLAFLLVIILLAIFGVRALQGRRLSIVIVAMAFALFLAGMIALYFENTREERMRTAMYEVR